MLTYANRIVALCILPAVLLLVFCTSCDPGPKHEPVRYTTKKKLEAPQWVTAGMDSYDIGFKSCSSPGQDSRQIARLGFGVAGAPEPLTMELTDPKNPRGANASTDYCEVELTPRIGTPDVVSEKRQECAVPGYFDLRLNLPGGKKLADFKLNEIGRIELVADSVNPKYDVELLSTTRRSMYAVYPHRAPGEDPPPLFAVEYLRDDCVTTRSLKAADDWTYSFTYAGGHLNLLPPGCLIGWPEYLRALAAGEDTYREKVAGENARKLRGEDCGSGG